MSLWSKPVESITYDDVNNFLMLKEREGPRLDYKADVPKELARLVAAFANTNGGLIILGVDADKKTNEPVWPPTAGGPGLKPAPGFDERILQICRDNILPPVRPQVSSPSPVPGHADKVVVVVRVDESPEAPHATDGGRRIYERTGSQNEPIAFAHLTRIKQMMDRRQRQEDEREAIIQTAIERALHQLGPRNLCAFTRPRPDGAVSMEGAVQMFIPLRWASVIPFYPWRELCSPEECYARHRNLPKTSFVQKVPGGSLATAGMSHYVPESTARSMFSTRGHIFFIERVREASWDLARQNELPATRRTPGNFWLGFDKTFELVKTTAKAARDFLKGVEIPGHLLLSVGFIDVRDFQMTRPKYTGDEELDDRHYKGGKFPDEKFRADVVFTSADFLTCARDPFAELFNQITDGFDLPRLSKEIAWSEAMA